MSVTKDANGWTVVAESSPSGEGSTFSGAGTRKIYVDSAAADDTGDGSEASPKKTLAAGVALLRPGSPDWLLLKKGGVWTNENFEAVPGDNFGYYGKSSDEPMLIGAYGTGARPLVKTANGSNCIYGIGASGSGGNYLCVIGIEGYSYQRDPNNAAYVGDATVSSGSFFFMFNTFGFLLIEDCKTSFYKDNFAIEPSTAASNFSFRRNVCVDAWNPDTDHSQGMYIQSVDGILIEENVFDHNGWNEVVVSGDATVFNRNVYVQSGKLSDGIGCTNVVSRGNVYARSSAEGAQFRSGGVVDNDLFVRNAIGPDIGHNEGHLLTTSAMVKNIVVTESEDRAFGVRGGGVTFLNASGAGVTGGSNIVCHGASTSVNAFSLQTDAYQSPGGSNDTGSGSDGTHGVVLSAIVYDWHLGTSDLGGANDGHGAANSFTIAEDLTGANTAGYTDPTRTVASYAGSIGLTASNDAFYAACRANSKDSWDARLLGSAVNDYFRAGFDLAKYNYHRVTLQVSI